MSKKDSQFQKKVMSFWYHGKGIFKPLNTGWIDEHVACVREWIANIFFYTKNGTTIMIDAGYNYDRLAEKMRWLDIELSKRSLEKLETLLRERGLQPKIITGHTGWTDNLDFAFAHRTEVCNGWKKQKPHDPKAPYDGYVETDDTEEKARGERLKKQDESIWRGQMNC